MNNDMASQYDYSISMICAMSMVAIITCHFMQYLDIELAWWFNVGVQVFLCISGYLYSDREISDPIEFYKKTIQKILVDYYVVIIVALGAYWVEAKNCINIAKSIRVLLVCDTLDGGGHLWFIATILACYLLTPLISSLYNRVAGKGVFRVFFQTCMMTLLCFILCRFYFYYFNPAMISCYIIGYALKRIEIEQSPIKENTFKIVFVIIGCVMNGIQVIHSYIMPLSIVTIFSKYWNVYCDYAHLMLGIGIFVVLHSLLYNIRYSGHLISVLKITDKYSYDIYLTNQFFILGPFSLMKLTPWIFVNVVIIGSIVALCAVIINQVSRWLKVNVLK